MKTFKVRVTGAGQARYWYANKIGQEFTVTDRNKGGYYIDGAGSRGLGGYIDKSDCVIVEGFKVGDRVRVRDECVGRQARSGDGGCGTIIMDWQVHLDSGCGTIIDAEPGMDWQVHLDSMKVGDWWSYYANELTLLEDTMEYTVNGTTYRQLRNITVKSLILAGADDNYVEHFDLSHDITEPILIKYAIDYALHSSYDFQKLVDQGFVEVVEEALKPCPFCGGEAIWVTEDKNWIMCKECRTDGRLRKSHQDAIDAWNKRV